MVATASVSAFSRVRIALSMMKAARELRTPRYDVAKHAVICMVGRQVDQVMGLMSQKISNHDAVKGPVWDGLSKADQLRLKGRGIVLLSHLSHTAFHAGLYVIGKKSDGEWFVLYHDPGRQGEEKTSCRIDDSTLMLMVVPGDFASIKLFIVACQETIEQMFDKKLKKLRAARKACALGWAAESFDLSLWQQATDHIRVLRTR